MYGSRLFNEAAARLWNEIVDEDLKRGDFRILQEKSEISYFSSGVFSVCLVSVLIT